MARARLMKNLALMAVMAMVLAACGSDEGGDETTTTAGGETATTMADGETTTTGTEDDGGECDVPSSPDDGVTDDEIRIGWLGDLTGPTASTQTATRDGASAYFEYLNDQGGLLGREVVLVPFDDGYVVDQTVLGFRQLVQDEKVLALVGLGNSSGIEALNEEIKEAMVPIIGSQSAAQTTHENEYFWNMIANNVDTMKVITGRMAEDFIGSTEDIVAIPVALTVASGDDWVSAVEEVVTGQGGTVLSEVRIDAGAEDMTAEAREISRLIEEEGANAIFLHGTIRPFVVLFSGLEQVGVTDTPIGAMQGMVQPQVYEQAPATVTENAWGVSSITPPSVDEPALIEMNEFVDTVGQWEETRHSLGFPLGWNNGKILEEAILRSAEGCELTRASLQQALGTISDFDLGGAGPTIDFTRPGHNGGAVGRPYEWDGSQLVPVGSYADWEPFVTG